MNSYRFQHILNWEEIDLSQLPKQENHEHEYKGGLTKDDDLGNKISKAASAFWNSGGGLFFIGIDDNGELDGGILNKVGRQNRQEWVDRQVAKTQPAGKYLIKSISSNVEGSSIKPNYVVIVVGFEESTNAPHMASDGRYYIRAGANSDPASHFLVEAIRSRRVVQTPILSAILRRSHRKSRVIELVLAVVNDSVALDVVLNFVPLPKALGENFSDRFPLKIPFIDRLNPFVMELFWWGGRSQTFGKEPVELHVDCKDLLDRSIPPFIQTIDVTNSIDPMTIGDTDAEQIEKAIKEVSKKLDKLDQIVDGIRTAKFLGDSD